MAPLDSIELATAYANGSAALFHLGQFESCKQWIEAARAHNYPPNQMEKLVKRSAACDRKLNLTSKSAGSTSNGSAPSNQDDSTSIDDKPKVNKAVQVSLIENEMAVMAGQPLNQGDEVVVEKAYFAILKEKNFEKHCYACLIRLDLTSPHPCRNCTQVVYCSIDCERSAWSRYHDFECRYVSMFCISEKFDLQLKLSVQVLGHLWKLASGSMNRLLRVVRQGFECQRKTRSDREDVAQLLDTLSLDDGEEQADVDYSDWFHQEHVQRDVQKYFDFCSFIQHPTQDQSNYRYAGLLAIAFLLHRNETLQLIESDLNCLLEMFCMHIRQIQVNALTISDRTVYSDATRNNSLQVATNEIGIGIYRWTRHLNHSCDPNAVVCSQRKTCLLVRTCRPIEAGEQIRIAYGVTARWETWATRRRMLQETYFFDCTCSACKQRIQPARLAVLCPKCGTTLDAEFKCFSCEMQPMRSVPEAMEMMSAIVQLIKMADQFVAKDNPLAVQMVRHVANELQQSTANFLHFGHIVLRDFELTVRKVFANTQHWSEALEHSRQYWKRLQCEYDCFDIHSLNGRLVIAFDWNQSLIASKQKHAQDRQDYVRFLNETQMLVDQIFTIEPDIRLELTNWLQSIQDNHN